MTTARTIRVAAAGGALALALAACGQGSDPAAPDETDAAAGGGGGGGDVELRFSWWGGDLRNELTQEVIDAFEAENPGITITPEFSDWTGYWDRLATTAAAGDLPDVMQMDEKYIRSYADQGSLMDLYTLEGLDTSDIDPAAKPSGEVDGSLYGLVTSINVYSVVANKTILEEAGVEVPDDTAWTWEDFADVARSVTESTGDGVYGMQYFGDADSQLSYWAHQQGETLWTDEGEVGISEETLTSFWEYTLELAESGAAAPASTQQEYIAATQELSGTATNKAAFGMWWSNQLSGLAASSGQDLELMQPPEASDGESAGTYYKPSMFWSASADTEHPEEVALFLDYLANSTDAGEILLVERGVPSNLTVREHITDMLEETDQEVVAFIDEVADEVIDAPPMTPAGASDIEALVERHMTEVLFGTMTPQEAAESFRAGAEEMVAG